MNGDAGETKEKRGLFSRLFGRAEAPREGVAGEAAPEGGEPEPPKRTWRERLFGGLFRSSQAIAKGIGEIFTKR